MNPAEEVQQKLVKKIVMNALGVVLSFLWVGSFCFIAYFSNQDLQYIKNYQDVGVYTFFPNEVIRIKRNRVSKPDDIFYKVEYINDQTEHVYRKRVLNRQQGYNIIEAEESQSRRVIEFAEDYITVPSEQTAQEYIQNRKNRNTLGVWGSVVGAIVGVGCFFFCCNNLKKLRKESNTNPE